MILEIGSLWMEEKVSLDNKITILGFGGSNLIENRGNLSILMKYTNAIIPLKIFSLLCCALGTEDDVKSILDALDEFTDVSQWHFCLLLLKD
jgi:hypothetical protein